MKKLFQLLIFVVIHNACFAQLEGYDFRLSRLKGIKKIVIKETTGIGRIYENGKMVLFLNSDGLVIRENDYDSAASWFRSYTIYGYLGTDTEATTIDVFSQMRMPPLKSSPYVHGVAYVNDFANPRHHEWRVYRFDTAGNRYLENTTASDYDPDGQIANCVYTDAGSSSLDSTSCIHHGDTTISIEYRRDRHDRFNPPVVSDPDIVVATKDSLGRLLRTEHIAGKYSGMLRREDYFYDKHGRYLGYKANQQCANCKTGWEKIEERRTYDTGSRLKSIVSYTDNKVTNRFDFSYFK